MPSVTVNSGVDIAATTDKVWEVLTDFARYEQWNPSMRIEGVAETGTKLVVHMSAAGAHGVTFQPKVLSAIPGRKLRWLGKLGFHGIVDGEHYFILTPKEDGTTHLDHVNASPASLSPSRKAVPERTATAVTTHSARHSKSGSRASASPADPPAVSVGSIGSIGSKELSHEVSLRR